MGDIFKTTAYHKSSQTKAAESVKMQAYSGCNRSDAWLGKGIYFWERKADAEKWDGKYVEPVITSAQLSCDNDYFLNLDTEEGMKSFKEFIQFCQSNLRLSEYDIAYSKKNDYYVSTFFCQFFKYKYKTLLMKYSFPEISAKPQYCATDNSVVSKIKLASVIECGEWKLL